jgi:hypothetical protein
LQIISGRKRKERQPLSTSRSTIMAMVVVVASQQSLVFESPVSRLQKDQNQTGLRLEKTRPAVLVF